MPSAHSEVAALSPSGLRSPPTPAQGDGQPRASFRRCRKGEKRESGRKSAQPGPGLPGPVAGRSRMPSWHPLTRCRPRCAILAALVGTRRLKGMGSPGPLSAAAGKARSVSRGVNRPNPARDCPAPSPDVRGCPRGIRSLDADRAAPSWLRLSAHAGSQGTGSPGPAVCLSRRRSRQSVCSGLRSPGEARLRARGGRTVAAAPASASTHARQANPRLHASDESTLAAPLAVSASGRPPPLSGGRGRPDVRPLGIRAAPWLRLRMPKRKPAGCRCFACIQSSQSASASRSGV